MWYNAVVCAMWQWDLTSVSAISISQDSRRAMRGRTCTFETLKQYALHPTYDTFTLDTHCSELYTARATALQLHATAPPSSIIHTIQYSCIVCRCAQHPSQHQRCMQSHSHPGFRHFLTHTLFRCRQPSGEARGYGRANAAERMHDNNNTALCIRAHARLLACCSAQLRSKPDSDLMA